MAQTSRTFRIFVSSTFSDLKTERNALQEKVFPRLRALAESHACRFQAIDLRWGVSDEASLDQQAMNICLGEIARCQQTSPRPNFIVLLGDRYGWIPDEIPQELVEREPWLAEHRSHSVTELEILHGVLNNPQMADHAYFYFRDPAFIDLLPALQQSAFREMPTPEEIQKHGDAEAKRRAEERKQELAVLKQRIRASGLPEDALLNDQPDGGQ